MIEAPLAEKYSDNGAFCVYRAEKTKLPDSPLIFHDRRVMIMKKMFFSGKGQLPGLLEYGIKLESRIILVRLGG